MADYSDISNSVKQYWATAWSALGAIIRELDKGTAVNSSKLSKSYDDIRPQSPGEMACSLCDRTKEAYNLVHGTTHTQTFEEMCAGEGCPGLEPCRHDVRKWHAFIPLAAVWYFKEGQFYAGEGNRYPHCQSLCQDFAGCEAAAPTDAINFAPLSQEAKDIKQTRCLREIYRVGTEGGWVDAIIAAWTG